MSKTNNIKTDNHISLFVPGRLCIFGEHSDWAGRHRIMNADLAEGMAIVTGIEEGIYADARLSKNFVVRDEVSSNPVEWTKLECEMDLQKLKAIAHSGGFYSYVAGVASYVSEWYHVGGIEIVINRRTMPIKSGLSSSAAICVLVARAFNQLYKLNLNTLGEMNIAFLGEQRTPSRCGRLDQACAFGSQPVCIRFDGHEISVERLVIKKELHMVISNVRGTKDTIKILADLNRSYPFAADDKDKVVHQALGEDNIAIVTKAIEFMRAGDLKALGNLMTRAQENFDQKVAPASPENLLAPALHELLKDNFIKRLAYGGKGVGSQGDGTVQFLSKGKKEQKELIDYLSSQGLAPFALTIPKKNTVRKAIIPVAGYGVRMYPATRAVKKEFLPIIDTDGLVKPAILKILEEACESGIEEICLVVGNDKDSQFYLDFFQNLLLDEHIMKLPARIRAYEQIIKDIGSRLHIVCQEEKRGFGHAVYQCRTFAAGEPVLLMLGDTIYKSHSKKTCAQQLIDAFEVINMSVVSIHSIPLEDVEHYGILYGTWEDSACKLMKVQTFYEKPSYEYAKEHLGMMGRNPAYFAVFGQYILTNDVFEQLEDDIARHGSKSDEIQLTSSLDAVRANHGLMGFVIDGEMFDIGNPEAYRRTMKEF